MKRRKRTEILVEGDPALAKRFAEEIREHYSVREISQPEHGTTMLKMRETAKNSLFYIGEVLMTEAKVEVEGQIGIGMAVGMKEELVKNLAIIDAAYKARLPEIESWKNSLLEEEKRIEEAKIQEQQEILKTKVNFDTMDVQ